MKTVMNGTIVDVVLDPEDARDRLGPCPFCGGKEVELIHAWTACYSVKCQAKDCGAEVVGRHANELRTARGRRVFRNYAKKSVDYQPKAHVAAALDALCRWDRRVPVMPSAALWIVTEAMMRGQIQLTSLSAGVGRTQISLDLEGPETGRLDLVFKVGCQNRGPALNVTVKS